jgi:hypothetical protein
MSVRAEKKRHLCYLCYLKITENTYHSFIYTYIHTYINTSIGWIRAGSDISYFSNSFQRNNTAGEGVANYYTLSFTIEFHNPKDTVLIAYSYPYTFADYKSHLQQILEKPGASSIIRQTKLCRTIGGEDCDLLVITNFRDKDKIGPITMAASESISTGNELAFGTKGENNLGGSSAGLTGSGGGGSSSSASTSGMNLASKQSTANSSRQTKAKINFKPVSIDISYYCCFVCMYVCMYVCMSYV